MALVRRIEIELGLLADGAGEGKAGGNHQRVVLVAGNRVGLGQLRRHLRLVGIGPGHEERGLGALGAHDGAVLLRIVGEDGFERGMDRALAAIHHDGDVEQPVELVEDDVVVRVEGIAADRVGPEIAFDIMPVEAGAADRHHGVAVGLLVFGVGGLFHQRQMTRQAVVVIEEAVADEDSGLGEIRTEAGDGRHGLRLCGRLVRRRIAASVTAITPKILDMSVLPDRLDFAAP